jgi:BirA family transcriptional regulator, biotin operon repressor / biotin---[acetyl-CoA-carboxylase] ligase
MDIPQAENPFPKARTEYVDSLPSTMEAALALAREGATTGSLVWAGEQTAGRGRFPERRWEGKRGASLLFTVVLRDPYPILPALSLRIGLAVCLALEAEAQARGLSVRGESAKYESPTLPWVKWPNDLVACVGFGASRMDGAGHGGRAGKLAGLLCEARPGFVLAGIGVNVNQSAFPAELNEKAASLRQCWGIEIGTGHLLGSILKELKTMPELLGWKAMLEGRLWKRGERVRFAPGLPGREEEIVARLRGIGPAGEIELEKNGEPLRFAAGELSYDS